MKTLGWLAVAAVCWVEAATCWVVAEEDSASDVSSSMRPRVSSE